MPAAPAWLDRLPSLLEKVASSEIPVYDRQAIEGLFSVRPRRAQQLLRELAAVAGVAGRFRCEVFKGSESCRQWRKRWNNNVLQAAMPNNSAMK
jgi:hypothetical protein